MAFDLEITNPRLHPAVVPHRIVPVRFARAVSGFSLKEAPDLDDHGFVIPSAFCTALGPVTGVRQTKKIRVKVIRDRLEPTVQLFPKVADEAIAKIEFPAPGTALSASDVGTRKGDCIYFEGTATGSTIQETKVKLHYGAVDGPVVAEMSVRVYPTLVIGVQAHLVTINGTGTATTMANIVKVFKRVNDVYAQAGVRFSLAAGQLNENVTGFNRAGTVTLTNTADQQNTELQTIMRLNPVANKLNAYFFNSYFDTVTGLRDQVLGIAFNRDDANNNPAAGTFPGCQAGITMRHSNDIKEVAHTTAHEIGHALRLSHYHNRNGNGVRNDIWAHRDLMHNFVNLVTNTPAGTNSRNSRARTQIGYGSYTDGRTMAGQLLMTKKLTKIRQSDQINVLRRATRNKSYAPI